MELKVLVTPIPKIKPSREPSSKTSRKAVGELEVELGEGILSGPLRLFARIFATVISSSRFYVASNSSALTLVRQHFIRLCNLLKLLFSHFFIFLLDLIVSLLAYMLIRMPLQCEFAIGFLDFLLRCIALYS